MSDRMAPSLGVPVEESRAPLCEKVWAASDPGSHTVRDPCACPSQTADGKRNSPGPSPALPNRAVSSPVGPNPWTNGGDAVSAQRVLSASTTSRTSQSASSWEERTVSESSSTGTTGSSGSPGPSQANPATSTRTAGTAQAAGERRFTVRLRPGPAARRPRWTRQPARSAPVRPHVRCSGALRPRRR